MSVVVMPALLLLYRAHAMHGGLTRELPVVRSRHIMLHCSKCVFSFVRAVGVLLDDQTFIMSAAVRQAQ